MEWQSTAMELLSLAVESFRERHKLPATVAESVSMLCKLFAHQVESLFTRLKLPATANIAIN